MWKQVMNNHKKQIALGAILSYVHIAVGAIITLLYTPFMIRTLGKSEYGLYSTVGSLCASLSLLSFGFGSSYVRFFSRFKSEGRKDEIDRLNGMFMVVFSIIGAIAFICGTYLSFNLEFVFDEGLSQLELTVAKKLMVLLTINMAISFPSSVFTSIITANERFIFQKSMVLVKQIVNPVICIPILLLGGASVSLVVCTFLVNIVIDIFNAVYCFKVLGIHFSFTRFPKNVFKELFVYSGFIALNMVVDQINLNIDRVLLGRFCGTMSVAVYAAGYTLYNYYHSFSTSISNVFIPRIHSIWNNRDLSETEKDYQLARIFANVGKIQFCILWLVCSALIVFGQVFITLWVGVGYENAYYVVLLLAISAIIPLSQNTGIEIQRAKNKHQFRSLLYAVMALINLALSIYLCQLYGEVGSAAGTAISFVVANTIIMNVFYKRILHIDISMYWSKCMRIVFATLPVLLFSLYYMRSCTVNGVLSLLIYICVYSILYIIAVFVLALSIVEKQYIVSKTKNLIVRMWNKI